MSVAPDAEQHEIEAGSDRRVVVSAVLCEIRMVGIEEVKRSRRQIDLIDQLAAQRCCRLSWIVRGKSAELVQREHGRVRE